MRFMLLTDFPVCSASSVCLTDGFFLLSLTPQVLLKYIPKCQIDTLKCTLEELAVLDFIKKNPSVKQTELAEQTGKSVRSIKRIIDSLKEKQYIRRVDGKRYGKWEVLV